MLYSSELLIFLLTEDIYHILVLFLNVILLWMIFFSPVLCINTTISVSRGVIFNNFFLITCYSFNGIVDLIPRSSPVLEIITRVGSSVKLIMIVPFDIFVRSTLLTIFYNNGLNIHPKLWTYTYRPPLCFCLTSIYWLFQLDNVVSFFFNLLNNFRSLYCFEDMLCVF